jgi:hypothetical protein
MFKTIIALVVATFATAQCSHDNYTTVGITPVNNCVQFTVGSGTGCQWMCNYCANQLGTFNYYFPDGVCTYQTGGCVGNPVAGKVYSCCAA